MLATSWTAEFCALHILNWVIGGAASVLYPMGISNGDKEPMLHKFARSWDKLTKLSLERSDPFFHLEWKFQICLTVHARPSLQVGTNQSKSFAQFTNRSGEYNSSTVCSFFITQALEQIEIPLPLITVIIVLAITFNSYGSNASFLLTFISFCNAVHAVQLIVRGNWNAHMMAHIELRKSTMGLSPYSKA